MNCGVSYTSFCWSDFAGFGWASTRSVSGECHNGGPGDKLEKITAPDCQARDAQPGFCPDFNILCAVMEQEVRGTRVIHL